VAQKILNQTFAFPANDQKFEAVTLRPEADGRGFTLVLQANGVESRFPCGAGEWKKGRGAFGTYLDEPAAGSVGWTSEDTCVVKLCLSETPFYTTLKMKFEGGQVLFDSETNVGFGASKKPQLVGRMK
jgi:hypothetical protein